MKPTVPAQHNLTTGAISNLPTTYQFVQYKPILPAADDKQGVVQHGSNNKNSGINTTSSPAVTNSGHVVITNAQITNNNDSMKESGVDDKASGDVVASLDASGTNYQYDEDEVI